MIKMVEGTRINFRVRPDLYELLRTLMYESRLSQQELVERALEAYLKKN
jgi:hypothetical protein